MVITWNFTRTWIYFQHLPSLFGYINLEPSETSMYGLQTAPSPRRTNCKIQRNIKKTILRGRNFGWKSKLEFPQQFSPPPPPLPLPLPLPPPSPWPLPLPLPSPLPSPSNAAAFMSYWQMAVVGQHTEGTNLIRYDICPHTWSTYRSQSFDTQITGYYPP